MDNEYARLAFDASLRSLDKQEHALEEIRARTGVLVAVASLAASVAARPALGRGNPTVVAMALVALAVSAAASIYILIPKKALAFAFSGPAVFERLYEFRDDPGEAQRRLAYEFDRLWLSNDIIVRRVVAAFRLAATALAVEVGLLLLTLSDTPFTDG